MHGHITSQLAPRGGDIFYSVVAEKMNFLPPNKNKTPHLK
jgi:hypothetical protein